MADPLNNNSSLIGQLYTQLQTENAKVADAKSDSDGFISKLFRRSAPKQTSSNPKIDETFLKETDRLKMDFVGLDREARIAVAEELILAKENNVQGADLLALALHLDGSNGLSIDSEFPSKWKKLKGKFKEAVEPHTGGDKVIGVDDALRRCEYAIKSRPFLVRMWNSATNAQRKKMAITLFQELGMKFYEESGFVDGAYRQVQQDLILSERADTVSELRPQLRDIKTATPKDLRQLYTITSRLDELRNEWQKDIYGCPNEFYQLKKDVDQQIDDCVKKMRLSGDLKGDEIGGLAGNLMRFLESQRGERAGQLRDELRSYGQTVVSEGYGSNYNSHSYWAIGSTLIYDAEKSKDDSRIAEAHAMSQNAADFIEQNKQELLELGWKPPPHHFWNAMR